MKISLRKASSISKKLINDALSSISDMELTVDVDVYRDDYESRLTHINQNVYGAMENKVAMTQTAYHLRHLVRQANEEHGINRLCDRMAECQALQRLFDAVDRNLPRERDEVYIKRLQERNDRNSEDRWISEIEIAPYGMEAEMKMESKKYSSEIREIEDQLTELNHSVKIELSHELALELQEWGYIKG